jgi:hypothetical protein
MIRFRALEESIWLKAVIRLCGWVLYPIFYSIVVLIDGIKNKLMTLIILAILGLVSALIPHVWNLFYVLNLLHTTYDRFAFLTILQQIYPIAFSIIMFVLSFKKDKTQKPINNEA